MDFDTMQWAQGKSRRNYESNFINNFIVMRFVCILNCKWIILIEPIPPIQYLHSILNYQKGNKKIDIIYSIGVRNLHSHQSIMKWCIEHIFTRFQTNLCNQRLPQSKFGRCVSDFDRHATCIAVGWLVQNLSPLSPWFIWWTRFPFHFSSNVK